MRGDLYVYAAEVVMCKQKNHAYKWLRIFVISKHKNTWGEEFTTLSTFAAEWSPFRG
jgi:hypothetical protein